ncbi:MAG: hypothetical protein ACYDCC_10600 [Actinomycetota bacterium]
MMTWVRTGFAAMILVATVAGVPAAADSSTCGGAITRSDEINDAKNPFTPLPVDSTWNSLDILSFAAQFTAEGLSVTWNLRGAFNALPKGVSSARLLVFGATEDDQEVMNGAQNYVFLELRLSASGPKYRVGVGDHSVYGPALRWIDRYSLPTDPRMQRSTVSIVVPGIMLTHHVIADAITYQGVVASDSQNPDSQLLHGQPTDPVAATAITLAPERDATTSQVWGLVDEVPDGRVVGTPYTGYLVSYVGPGTQPILCRPDPIASNETPNRCVFDWKNVRGPMWLSAKITTNGPSTGLMSMGSYGDPSVAPALGIRSNGGTMTAIVKQPLSTGTLAHAHIGTSSASNAKPPSEAAFAGSFSLFPDDMPINGDWWFFALLPASTHDAFVHFEVTGPNAVCGSSSTGPDVGFIEPSQMGTVGASAEGPDNVEGPNDLVGTSVDEMASASVAGRIRVKVRKGFVGFFGGDNIGDGVYLHSFWERRPDGGLVRAYEDGTQDYLGRRGRSFLADIGPAGTYRFGVDYGAWVGTSTDSPTLIWADIAWPGA